MEALTAPLVRQAPARSGYRKEEGLSAPMRPEEAREKMAGRIAAELVSLEMVAREIESSRLYYVPLEAFLLHARKLRDFFRAGDAVPADAVLAEHFLKDPESWSLERGALVADRLEETHTAVNEKLAGFRWGSGGGEALRWGEWVDAVPGLLEELKAHWDAFLAAVDPRTRGWFLDGYKKHRDIQGWGRSDQGK